MTEKETDADGTVRYVPSAIARSYREQYSEIYIDEYQDTNMLQEIILSSVSSEAGPYRFMVGDMKQSIYAFRSARPELFVEKYGTYVPADGEEPVAAEPGVLIRLNRNFRSRAQVIDAVNAVFSAVMNPVTGGMPYTRSEFLDFGAEYYLTAAADGGKNGGDDDTAAADGEKNGDWAGGGTVTAKEIDAAAAGNAIEPEGCAAGRTTGAFSAKNDPYRTLLVIVERGETDGETAEAHEIFRRIEEMVGSGFRVYDKDKKAMRPVDYGDVCILMRKKKFAPFLSKYLNERGIPVNTIPDRGGLFRRPAVMTATSFLRIIDNPLNDIPLLAVLKNVYGFGAGLIARITAETGKKKNLYRRLTEFAAGAEIESGAEFAAGAGFEAGAEDDRKARRQDADRQLTAAFLRRLDRFRDNAPYRPVADTLWECLHENGFLDAVRTGGNAAAYPDLMKLMKIAAEFDKSGEGGCYEFILAVDRYESKKESQRGTADAGTSGRAVSIMTIHGSKGLEFPVVFLADTAGKRNSSDETAALLMHKDLGFGPKCFDSARKIQYPSLVREAVRLRLEYDARAEEMRLLYVAMTRAREKLIITGVVKDADGFINKCESVIDRDAGRPSDHHVMKAGTLMELVTMAALCPDYRSVLVEKGRYAEEVSALREERTDPVSFGLPAMRLWSPGPDGGETGGSEPDGGLCPAKLSVSEVKRMADTALAEAEADAAGFGAAAEGAFRGGPERKAEDYMFDSAPQREMASEVAEKGTLLHCCLEHMDFRAARDAASSGNAAAYARELTERLCAEGFMTAQDALKVPEDLLTAFIRSDVARRLSEADAVFREIPFTLDLPSDLLLGNALFEGKNTAVQGVIDCVFKDGPALVLLDYKSDTVRGGDFAGHSGKYIPQLSIYAEACRRYFGKYPDRVVLYYLKYGKIYEFNGDVLKKWSR